MRWFYAVRRRALALCARDGGAFSSIISRMNRPVLGAVLVPVLSLLVGCAGATSNVRRPQEVDALFADYDAPERPGASVVVLHEGKVVFSRAYGLADVGTRTKATPESHYRLASLSKQFTAMAVLLLVEEGKLRLEDRVVDVLPDFPSYLGEVRVHHLLQHTSGIWDYEAFVPATQTEQVKDRDVLALLSRADRTYFAPGSAVRYSNSAYAVLSLVVEKVSGVSFARFLRERVFTPGGMASAVAHEEGVSTVPQRAYGHASRDEGFVPRDQSNTSAVLGDGGIYASVVDLAAWDVALDADTLVDAKARARAWTPVKLPDGASGRYGFGWFVDEDQGRTRLSHHGETCGFTNAIVKYPDQRLTVIVLTNRAGGAPWTLAQHVADLWLGTPVTPRPWPFESMANAH
ncbi:serine hydrolase domain-containing protein [Myxococcus qinghaiensis]|uniref:serine hydrolase domain-containing protein n=1 Tax=Myxococcus qinghaiensis TaxID=2906758 RepID=UPI0020A6F82C|nr:beta-lactamase family protein [Myxococcus qinghaiensis]MCP3169788.1 beta-lactamase family protein [Myxococcus qinghaiensis]